MTHTAGRLRLVGFPAEVAGRTWTGPELDPQVVTHRDAVALPLRSGGPGGQRLLGAIYDRAGRLVVDSERAKFNRAWAGNPSRQPPGLADGATRLDGRSLFAGHRRPVFGHFLLEVMPRLWPDLDYAGFDHVLVYPTRLGEHLRGLEPYETDLLVALGIDASRLVLVDRPLVLAEVTVPTATFALKRSAAPAFVAAFDRAARALLPDPVASPGRRIYLSRSHLDPKLRRAENEREIESLLTTLGFEVLHPQELTIAEQVRAVRDADAVAGCDGSALHLAAFARPGTALFGIDSRLVENQLLIDVVRGLDAVHVLAPAAGASRRDESWVADLDLVRQGLATAGLDA